MGEMATSSDCDNQVELCSRNLNGLFQRSNTDEASPCRNMQVVIFHSWCGRKRQFFHYRNPSTGAVLRTQKHGLQTRAIWFKSISYKAFQKCICLIFLIEYLEKRKTSQSKQIHHGPKAGAIFSCSHHFYPIGALVWKAAWRTQRRHRGFERLPHVRLCSLGLQFNGCNFNYFFPLVSALLFYILTSEDRLGR